MGKEKNVGVVILGIIILTLFMTLIYPLFFWHFPRLMIFFEIIFLISGVIFFIGITYITFPHFPKDFSLNFKNSVYVITLLLVLIFISLNFTDNTQDLISYELIFFEGVYEDRGFSTKYSTHQYVIVDGEQFYVPLYNNGLDEIGKKYKLWYLPHTRKIVQYEEVSMDNNK